MIVCLFLNEALSERKRAKKCHQSILVFKLQLSQRNPDNPSSHRRAKLEERLHVPRSRSCGLAANPQSCCCWHFVSVPLCCP